MSLRSPAMMPGSLAPRSLVVSRLCAGRLSSPGDLPAVVIDDLRRPRGDARRVESRQVPSQATRSLRVRPGASISSGPNRQSARVFRTKGREDREDGRDRKAGERRLVVGSRPRTRRPGRKDSAPSIRPAVVPVRATRRQGSPNPTPNRSTMGKEGRHCRLSSGNARDYVSGRATPARSRR